MEKGGNGATLLTNGTIYTFDPGAPHAEAVLIRAGRIHLAGDLQEARRLSPTRAEVIDLGGCVVLPGLIDAHIHLESLALALDRVDCNTTGLDTCLERVSARAKATPEGAWILGHGWNQNRWERFGHRRDLDPLTPDQPVYLTALSLHAAWANTEALRIAGVSAETPDPPGGRIQRDPDGAPTGILFETAMQLVDSIIPEPGLDRRLAALRRAQKQLWRFGLTGLHEFDRASSFEVLQALHAQGGLGLRVRKILPLEDLDHALSIGLREGFGDGRLRLSAVKLFSDGALGPRTAAMLEPYLEEPDNLGILLLEMDEIVDIGRRAAAGGFPLFIHAIGDRANHLVLDALEELRAVEREEGWPRLRHRVEHAQLLHPDDLARFANLDVIASMQPIHAPSDREMADRYWGERSRHAYAWRSLLDSGARLAFGSDAPVDSASPFVGLFAASTRQSPHDPTVPAWLPEECVSRMQALQCYAQGAAYSTGDSRLGRLSLGYHADLIVLENDPLLVPPQDLVSMESVGTMVGGEWVYRRF